jgi:hypothetical protein
MTSLAPYQLFPDLADDDYAALKRDIAEHGVMVPVEYDDDGNILDGHHRVRAWTELVYDGVALDTYPRVIREGLSEAQKRAHVRRLNILRRHLTQEQKRDLIRDQVRETPERSNRQVGAALGVDHKTVAPIREQLESTGEIPQSEARQGADGRVINTANIGGRPAPVRHAPDPDIQDDYVEDVNQDTESTEPPAPEPDPISLDALADERDDDGSVARARLLAQYSTAIATVFKLQFLDADAVTHALSRERRVIHRENARLLRLWLDAMDRAIDVVEERPLQIVGGTHG